MHRIINVPCFANKLITANIHVSQKLITWIQIQSTFILYQSIPYGIKSGGCQFKHSLWFEAIRCPQIEKFLYLHPTSVQSWQKLIDFFRQTWTTLFTYVNVPVGTDQQHGTRDTRVMWIALSGACTYKVVHTHNHPFAITLGTFCYL